MGEGEGIQIRVWIYWNWGDIEYKASKTASSEIMYERTDSIDGSKDTADNA